MEMAGNLSSSFNPWSTGGGVAGINLGDPQSGLVVARRHGIVPTLEVSNVFDMCTQFESVTRTAGLVFGRLYIGTLHPCMHCRETVLGA